ncbi:SirB1 family protein [[Haemophilus] ducreyi]|uniref:SirB1 family protein n=1 Tax=Haemophilus ducreyi TaxID=730 RepID=UPI0006566F6A|nr:tetratricopeptide repeat protein [[Haemophilus] ducreyi]AKO45275.1 hypothetical protein RZ66_03115 [[Haemophilus] ducreyi]AKO46677.1 hypothetical protein RZ67_03095 [[Haemophilus] ducreyi]AKO48018.1 hypothetical protein RZ68_03090 [[Haemophilus] ducreyi]AKO49405.1 hypothetical protein RZ69_03125 [[Haemophilus] ducreyi]ANF61556.1 hypothetical protein A6037_01665 [[Haemophilus] ducreyi]
MDDIIQQLFKEVERPQLTVNEQALQQYLYREIVRLTLLVEPTISKPQIIGLLSALVKKARHYVNADNQAECIQQLLDLVYQEWRFHCDYQEYFYTDNLLLHHVIRSHRGMPLSIGAIVLYLAAKLQLPIYPVNFPTQLILRAEITESSGKKTVRFINPWDGQFLPLELLLKWLEGEVGYGVELSPELLRRADPAELLERVETVFKMVLTREGKYEQTLRLIEYRLAENPDDPYEIRDRGMVLASMDCYQAAYDDLSYFIDQCPDDPSAAILKSEVKVLEQKSKQNQVH